MAAAIGDPFSDGGIIVRIRTQAGPAASNKDAGSEGEILILIAFHTEMMNECEVNAVCVCLCNKAGQCRPSHLSCRNPRFPQVNYGWRGSTPQPQVCEEDAVVAGRLAVEAWRRRVVVGKGFEADLGARTPTSGGDEHIGCWASASAWALTWVGWTTKQGERKKKRERNRESEAIH